MGLGWLGGELRSITHFLLNSFHPNPNKQSLIWPGLHSSFNFIYLFFSSLFAESTKSIKLRDSWRREFDWIVGWLLISCFVAGYELPLLLPRRDCLHQFHQLTPATLLAFALLMKRRKEMNWVDFLFIKEEGLNEREEMDWVSRWGQHTITHYSVIWKF